MDVTFILTPFTEVGDFWALNFWPPGRVQWEVSKPQDH